MLKNIALLALAVAAVVLTTTPSIAASRHGQLINVGIHVFSVEDNSILQDLNTAIARLPGAVLVSDGKSVKGAVTPIRAWIIDTKALEENSVAGALSAFHPSELTSIANAIPTGRMTPVEVGTDRAYVRAISFEAGENGRSKRSVETASVNTGYKLHLTPRVRKDGIHLAVEQRVSALTGPDDGFRNFKVDGGVVQLKQTAQRAISYDDIHMPGPDKAIVILQPGLVAKNEYLVTVLKAEVSR
jgi:hypothetical protein